MFIYPVPQRDPPLPPSETLPTMYDLPSEDPGEPGLPDEYHYLQPHLLSATLRLKNYSSEEVFSVGDMNLYYDVRHPLWYKRPDWFLVLGVPRLYEQRDLRLSYVIWQEGISPFMVVELLSPGTEREDLGETTPASETPPTKWFVYEQILRVPYYVVFNRYTDDFQVFQLTGSHYQPLTTTSSRIWIAELELGLGIWHGEYGGVTRSWLRWYDDGEAWLPTDGERAEQERQRAEQAEAANARLIEQLRARGIDPDE